MDDRISDELNLDPNYQKTIDYVQDYINIYEKTMKCISVHKTASKSMSVSNSQIEYR